MGILDWLYLCFGREQPEAVMDRKTPGAPGPGKTVMLVFETGMENPPKSFSRVN